ncbi:hypothetical protein HPB50_021538 [Hyalomma asiaticum]|uniref:Uncharacterized protein n=1 Tax=Hyalomma asiaticum TaxID=266040 RepID=A0ACB7RJK7_HYAAI|nr:hypothetical protein HPB50_021538 [Hyalomma asiaticum]
MSFVMKLAWLACVVTTAAALANGRGPSSCESKLHNCTDLVKPFLNDLRYMFPTTIEDVDDMCKMWSRFVDCIRRYVTDCATEDQRSKFNNAVGDSIDTVHAICSSERYQKEYLQNASCFRKVSVDNLRRLLHSHGGPGHQPGFKARPHMLLVQPIQELRQRALAEVVRQPG